MPGTSGPGFPGGPMPGFPGTPGTPMPGAGGTGQAPTSPPPGFIPPKPFSLQSAGPGGAVAFVDPGAISRCLFRFTYIWLANGQQFWFFPIFVGPTSIAGFRWTGWTWAYFGIDLRLIDAFTCS
ncbi:collagen-like protein [Paenibacillus koleovorans]|uniref:collagen-like protein n=1 Tax=Paenibacillus koleovorans TaxID=121608 RepID=UPI001FE5C9EB|nr:collagen-like protein [Paenibacillus koleovorans]